MPCNETPYTEETTMFTKKTDINATALKMEIDSLFAKLSTVEKGSSEYEAIRKDIEVLYPLRKVDHEVNSGTRVSADTIAAIAANLAGILIIVNYERAAVLTSKAVSFLKIVK